MRKTSRRQVLQLAGAALTQSRAAAQAPSASSPLTLWFRFPAKTWVEALPVGNGTLGAMEFGGVEHERLQLNEHSLWSGHPEVIDSPKTLEVLPKVRALLFAGKYSEAQQMASRDLMVHTKATPAPYQTLG